MTPVDADGRRWRRRLTLSLLPSRRTGDIRVHRRLGRTPGATGFVGHRPTWSPLHREIPEGNRRVQHGVEHELINVAGKAVMLSRRFDRESAIRIPFLSAMAMVGAKDGERGSYPDIVDH